MGKQSKKKEIEERYKDAYCSHQSRKGIHSYRMEVEIRRRKALTEEL